MLLRIYGGGKTPKVMPKNEKTRNNVKGFYENLMKKNPKVGDP